MRSYLELLQHVMLNGHDSADRTGTGTRKVFGYQWRHSLSDGFPLLTTKKIFFKGVVAELLWFLSGDTNVNTLIRQGVHIWDQWADNVTGDLGPVYGWQWRHYGAAYPNGPGGVDQIQRLIDSLQKEPNSRRHIVTAWNPEQTGMMKLPPCHPFWQCQVDGHALHLSLYMRSCDAFIGCPFNIASYALLLHLLAREAELEPGDLIISYGDLHIYNNHQDQVLKQLEREPRALPTLHIDEDGPDIFDLRPEHIRVLVYNPYPAIKAPISV